MIGLSLSFCVRDIIRGKVAIADVDFIVSGACAGSQEEWEELLSSYARTYWSEAPEQAREIALQLIGDGRVVQPRLESGMAPQLGNGSVWVEDHKEIAYFQASNLQQVREAMERWERKHATFH